MCVVLRVEPLPDPTKFSRREGEAEKQAERRRNADQEVEFTAVTCVAVYMLLMTFSQRGIDKLRNYQEHLRMRYPDGDFVVSVGFDDGIFCLCLRSMHTTSDMFWLVSACVVQGAVHQV